MRSFAEIDLESGQRRSSGFHVLFFGFGEFALKWTNQYSNDYFVFFADYFDVSADYLLGQE